MNYKILHITPHLGGGVGKVLLNWLAYDNTHKQEIACLDYANEKAIQFCKDKNLPLYSEIAAQDLLKKISEADITVIHFWNHPLLYNFLVRNPLPEARIAIWSHISGANPPYVFNKKLFNICDKFVFTTPISYDYTEANPKYACILSTGGTEQFENIKPEAHDGFNAGYIGTVDFAKMHPLFVETLTKTKADKIYITGGDNEKQIFRGSSPRFKVTGKLADISEILKKLDVFAYLLNPEHYGTGEQVLQEAMAAGVVPVVLNNPCEKTLVKHQETGLVADNLEEYVNYINLLGKNAHLRKMLSKNAKNYAKKFFSLKTMNKQWNKIFKELMQLPRTEKLWNFDKSNPTSYDIFLESLGDWRDIFENKTDKELQNVLKNPNWTSETKGTPKQYYSFLKGKELEHLCSLY